MIREITDQKIQQVFSLAFVLHPRIDVALRVTMDALDLLRRLEANETRRRRSIRHWKTAIPSEMLLQVAVFIASDRRERDQESPRPRLEPKYLPTRDDLVVRYVKRLILKTALLNWRYVAIGIGCLLYSYKPSDIADLLLFECEENNLRKVKMGIARDLSDRFSDSGVVPPNSKSIRTRPANDHDRLLVRQALEAFTPWQSDHLTPAVPNALLFETLFDKKNPISDWDLKHALIDPQCAGFERLVNEYNDFYSSTSVSRRLADPLENLVVPDFQGTPTPPLQRFNAPLLSESEKTLLRERRMPSGPWAWAYDLDSLEFYSYDFGFADEHVENNPECAAETGADCWYDLVACMNKLFVRPADPGTLKGTETGQSQEGKRLDNPSRVSSEQSKGSADGESPTSPAFIVYITSVGMGGGAMATLRRIISLAHYLKLIDTMASSSTAEVDFQKRSKVIPGYVVGREEFHLSGLERGLIISSSRGNGPGCTCDEFVEIVGPNSQVHDISSHNVDDQSERKVEENHMQEKIKILFLAANPSDTSALRMREEVRQIEEKIGFGPIKTIMESEDDSALDDVARIRGKSAVAVVKYALGDFVGGNELDQSNWKAANRLESDGESELKWIASYGYFNSTLFLGDFQMAMRLMAEPHRDAFEFIQKHAVGVSELQRILLQHQPHIVHFSGHDNETQEIVLKDLQGESKGITKKSLTKLFTILKDNLLVVVLNACYSKLQAEALNGIVDFTRSKVMYGYEVGREEFELSRSEWSLSSWFRENGPSGTGGEFVEIFDASTVDVLVPYLSNDPGGVSNGTVYVSGFPIESLQDEAIHPLRHAEDCRNMLVEDFEYELISAMPNLKNLLRVRGRYLDPADGEDMLQQVIYRAWKRFFEVGAATNTRAWLFTALSTMIRIHNRSRIKEPMRDVPIIFEKSETRVRPPLRAPRGMSSVLKVWGMSATKKANGKSTKLIPHVRLVRDFARSQPKTMAPDWYYSLRAPLISQEACDGRLKHGTEPRRSTPFRRLDAWIERTDWYDNRNARRILDSVLSSEEECYKPSASNYGGSDSSIDLSCSLRSLILRSELTGRHEESCWG